MKKDYWKILISLFVLGVALIIVYKTVDNVGSIFAAIQNFIGIITPFFIGFIIAYLLYRPAAQIERLIKKANINKFARPLSVLVIYLIIAVIITVLLSIALPTISKSIASFVVEFPNYFNQAVDFAKEFVKDGRLGIDIDIDALLKSFSIEKFLNSFEINDIGKYAQGIMNVSSILINTFLAVVTSIYILLGRRNLKKTAVKLFALAIPEKQLGMVLKYIRKTHQYFSSFIYCQIIDACILGTGATIGLSIIGVEYSIILGPLIGLFNIIPYFGAVVMSVISCVIVLFSQGLGKAVIMAVFLIVLQQIDGNILQPRILGNALKLSPLWVIIGITIGGAYLGVFGMIIAIPIVALIKTMISDVMDFRANKSKEKEEIAASFESRTTEGSET